MSSTPDTPDDEAPPLMKTLEMYLRDHSVGDLATAIETHGIHGWDRFGRFCHFKPDSLVVNGILNDLAEQKEWEDGGSGVLNKYQGQSPAEYAASYYDTLPTPWTGCGWRDGQIPDLGFVVKKAKRLSDITKREDIVLTLMAALALAVDIDIRDPKAAIRLGEIMEASPFQTPAPGTLRDIVARAREAFERKMRKTD